MDRNALLLGDATPATRIIEIGPSHAPIAAKRAGWNSFVVDHADQAELRAKYAEFGVEIAAIEHVDGVWHGGRLDSAVPPALHGTFDRLIASHVIEHIPDIVTFLDSAQALLTPDGTLALAVPDKRYCFDALKPITTTGDILAAHDPNGPGRHKKRTLFNQVAYSVAMDDQPAWGQHPVHSAKFMNSLADAVAFHAAASEAPDSAYVDAHAWQFTPAAFQLAILELAEAGLIDWRVAECSPAQGSEFIVTLHRGRPAWPDAAQREARRMELLLAILVEQREQIDYAALGGLITIPNQPADQAQAVSDLGARLLATHAQISTITAADGTQASIMGSLAQIAARQQQQQQAIDSLAAQPVAPLIHALAARIEAQQRQLDEVHRVSTWVRRVLRPALRLRARVLGRPFVE